MDEEHDSSFKQEEGVPYHGRDMAIVRAQLESIPIILASATPSLETLYNVEQGRYQSYPLPLRHGSAVLPKIRMIDLTRDMPERGSFLAPSLLGAMTETLGRGEQVALFFEPPRLCPLDPVPRLRPSIPVSILYDLVGRASAGQFQSSATTGMSPMWCHSLGAKTMPRMSGDG